MYPTTLEGMERKLATMLGPQQEKAQKAIEKIQYDINHRVDSLVNFDSTPDVMFDSNGRLRIGFNDNWYKLHNNALKQLSLLYKIPTKYVNNLNESEWGRELLIKTFAEHKANWQGRRLFVRTIDDEVRGILSDSYRRLNSNEIYQEFINAAYANGAQIYDATYTDVKTFIAVVIPKVFEVRTTENGVVYSLFGAQIRNSDFGAAALECRIIQINLVCDNQMVSETAIREIHRGSKFPKGINFSVDTYNYDTKAQASAINDIVTQSLSRETILNTVDVIQKAGSELIEVDKEYKKLSKKIHENELELLKSKMANSRIEDGLYGAGTKWKLAQGLTSVSQADFVDPGRKQELDTLAGEILNFKVI